VDDKREYKVYENFDFCSLTTLFIQFNSRVFNSMLSVFFSLCDLCFLIIDMSWKCVTAQKYLNTGGVQNSRALDVCYFYWL